jgi:tRNA uridine 5-carboxymethylaminomethyl modification enzyme
VRKALEVYITPGESLNSLLFEKGLAEAKSSVKLFDLLKRSEIRYTDLLKLRADLPVPSENVIDQIEIQAHYDGYIQKQIDQVERARRMEETALPEDLDYTAIPALRTEARQKLSAKRPSNLGQASRIPGVSPADIAVLLVKLKQLKPGGS